jgi:hypothetical protein
MWKDLVTANSMFIVSCKKVVNDKQGRIILYSFGWREKHSVHIDIFPSLVYYCKYIINCFWFPIMHYYDLKEKTIEQENKVVQILSNISSLCPTLLG